MLLFIWWIFILWSIYVVHRCGFRNEILCFHATSKNNTVYIITLYVFFNIYYYTLFHFNIYWIKENIMKINCVRHLKFSLVNKIRFFTTLGYHNDIFNNTPYWTRMSMLYYVFNYIIIIKIIDLSIWLVCFRRIKWFVYYTIHNNWALN